MAITVPHGKACAFCDYLGGKRPYTVLWREDKVAVLVTREQRGASHLLVIPKAHYPTILEMPDADASALLVAVRDAAQAIVDAENVQGISIWQNNGKTAHQTIGHLHFHVAGALEDGGTEFGDVAELPVAATDGIAERLAHYVRPDGRLIFPRHAADT